MTRKARPSWQTHPELYRHKDEENQYETLSFEKQQNLFNELVKEIRCALDKDGCNADPFLLALLRDSAAAIELLASNQMPKELEHCERGNDGLIYLEIPKESAYGKKGMWGKGETIAKAYANAKQRAMGLIE
jgi:hypothetical protein